MQLLSKGGEPPADRPRTALEQALGALGLEPPTPFCVTVVVEGAATKRTLRAYYSSWAAASDPALASLAPGCELAPLALELVCCATRLAWAGHAGPS